MTCGINAVIAPPAARVTKARKHVGKPCFGIDVVEARGHDEGFYDGGSLGTAIGSREQPCLAAKIRPSSTNRAKPSQRFSK